MAQESKSRKGGRTNAPRVKIAYHLNVGGEDRRKELPFVLGVLGDLAGLPDPPMPKLRERAFIEISTASVNTAMKSVRPRLKFSVPNRLSEHEGKLSITLRFERLEDFEPEIVAKQVEPLRRLIALRQHLSGLRRAASQDSSTAPTHLRTVTHARSKAEVKR